MLKNPVQNRCIQSIAHPVTIFFGALLWINAAILQPSHPSWWTGKLGDAAWLVIAPFFCSAVLAWFLHMASDDDTHRIINLSLLIVGLIFSLGKLLPSANHLISQGLTPLIGITFKFQLDPTDLVVLPVLLVTLWIWRHPFPYGKFQKYIQTGAALISVAAMLADAPAPFDQGITCVGSAGNRVIAIRQMSTRGYGKSQKYQNAYVSEDGGETWKYDEMISGKVTPTPGTTGSTTPAPLASELLNFCPPRPETWNLSDPVDPNTQYLFMGGQGVYRSVDGGKEFKQEVPLEKGDRVQSAVTLPNQEIVLALGLRGVLLHKDDSDWKWVDLETFTKIY
jgi:hypothetical protein